MPKALVVDDEAPARSELIYLLGECEGVEIVGEASSAAEAIQLIKSVQCDVIFLDIQMPSITGLQFAEALSTLRHHPAIIFVTAYSEHAVKAFEVHAADYLIKPIDFDRLKQALARLEPADKPARSIDRLPVEKGGRKLLVGIDEILYLMAKDDYVYVYTDTDRYMSMASLSQLETRLGELGFFRVHRRYLVNLARVREVCPAPGATLTLTLADEAKTQIGVSRRRAAALKEALQL